MRTSTYEIMKNAYLYAVSNAIGSYDWALSVNEKYLEDMLYKVRSKLNDVNDSTTLPKRVDREHEKIAEERQICDCRIAISTFYLMWALFNIYCVIWYIFFSNIHSIFLGIALGINAGASLFFVEEHRLHQALKKREALSEENVKSRINDVIEDYQIEREQLLECYDMLNSILDSINCDTDEEDLDFSI